MSDILESPRIGEWIQTYGGKFWPKDPRPEEIHIETIAHALSMLCRYGGHCMEFYSVAQHAVLCSRVAPQEHKLEALLHDASEAYLLDLVRPVKRMLPDYMALEQSIEKVIAAKFGLPFPMSAVVKEIDERMLVTEASQLLNHDSGLWWKDPAFPAPYGMVIDPWSPRNAKEEFLLMFYGLT